MAITLDSVYLPEDLSWPDEFDYDAVAQKVTYTEDGTPIVEETARAGGRPITLVGAPISREKLLELQAMAATPLATYPLTLHDGRTFTVMFRRPAIKAVPVVDFADPAAADLYDLQALNFIQV